MRYLFLILLVPGLAMADEFAPLIRWDWPTEYQSGKTLPISEIKEGRLYCDFQAQTLVVQVFQNTDTEWQAPVGFFPDGSSSCQMSAMDIQDREGLKGPVKIITVTPDAPGPVVIFEVN